MLVAEVGSNPAQKEVVRTGWIEMQKRSVLYSAEPIRGLGFVRLANRCHILRLAGLKLPRRDGAAAHLLDFVYFCQLSCHEIVSGSCPAQQ